MFLCKSYCVFAPLLTTYSYSPLFCEEKIDIWKNKKDVTSENIKKEPTDIQKKNNLESSQTIQALEKIQIYQSLFRSR